ncbi:hypothetical protein EVAR_21627_1 [Eumeta japonica]|uniref:Uncharacterized protein n=1 Tax=Eumeta variegata TaxID=151549 RepID=A0A4C1UY36_EUMVA|nr:hypothetical protein EVAR_21627_1 [Eumeta japonica]
MLRKLASGSHRSRVAVARGGGPAGAPTPLLITQRRPARPRPTLRYTKRIYKTRPSLGHVCNDRAKIMIFPVLREIVKKKSTDDRIKAHFRTNAECPPGRGGGAGGALPVDTFGERRHAPQSVADDPA